MGIDDEYQAASKVNKHYESKTEPYFVYYDSVVLDVTEEIN